MPEHNLDIFQHVAERRLSSEEGAEWMEARAYRRQYFVLRRDFQVVLAISIVLSLVAILVNR